eukprot:TRINITY_DN1314_c0_g2_i3.p1 TRINITY_DN1314_c0_g2~~TRINITY_DN1314_c0_g2_i3.p1  ORF type:complete len:256 (-),score=30.21 TRINITY_DN1314_c0_g2_i3:131-898(-)
MSNEGKQWLSDYNRALDLANDLQGEINERNRHMAQQLNVSKENTLIRRNLAQLNSEISSLRDALSKMLLDPPKYRVTENELQRRRDLVSNLTHKRDYLNSLMREGGNSVTNDRGALMGGGGRGGMGAGRQYSSKQETDQTRALENHEILQLQNRVMETQDNKLDDLSKAVNNVKQIGLAVNEELDLHQHLLSDIDAGVDKTSGKLRRETKRLNKITKKQKSCCALVCMFLLIAILVTLALTKWGCLIVKKKEECK